MLTRVAKREVECGVWSPTCQPSNHANQIMPSSSSLLMVLVLSIGISSAFFCSISPLGRRCTKHVDFSSSSLQQRQTQMQETEDEDCLHQHQHQHQHQQPNSAINTTNNVKKEEECLLLPETNPNFDPNTQSLSLVPYSLVISGINALYPPNELSKRNAASRTDGYWKVSFCLYFM